MVDAAVRRSGGRAGDGWADDDRADDDRAGDRRGAGGGRDGGDGGGGGGRRGGRGGRRKKPSRPKAPLWARLCAVFGVLITIASGGLLISSELLLARYEGAVATGDLFGDQAAGQPVKHKEIKGPLNILLVGIDPRASKPNWRPNADSVLILHLPVELDRGYLFSLPRDLLVDIPAFPKANFNGSREKLAHAMSYGSVVPGQEKPDAARGFELLAKAVSNYTGIERFDAGAIINFTGFRKIVDAMGGVDMYVDTRVESIHMQPDGVHRKARPGGGDGENAYMGPQKVYEKGQQHLKGWEALDYVRQRYIPGGDYARQRHQQQFIRAMVSQAISKDVVTNPAKLDRVVRAAGEALIFSGRGNSVIDFAFALRAIRADSLVMIKLPGGGVMPNGKYLGEQLQPIAEDFFEAVRSGQIDTFVLNHPELVNRNK